MFTLTLAPVVSEEEQDYEEAGETEQWEREKRDHRKQEKETRKKPGTQPHSPAGGKRSRRKR